MQTCRALTHFIYYLLSAKIAAFIPQGGRLTLPMPSIRVAGFTSGQVFCELKIILWNCYKRVLFSSTVGRIYVKL
ncbi:leptin receptor overlapping transcript-like 1, isoform CRA_b [Rattus norvegicus]|uniref:Leptin receptor overlapping transcript-like 1, isoform CRA_b n=1 Tax=Rattus norvegicus TaxID=10116 RepID=A6IVP6_RAT|nr:leptin receptor overlapping transcript-like 1, isoform CRA_b [Rattus norvegicus]